MTTTIRTVVVATVLALAVSAGVALGSPATTTTTTDEQANETATVTFSDQQIDGETVTIDSATLPDGGFAVVYDQGGERLGHSEYLSAGDHENVTVSLNRSVETAQVLVVTLYRNNGTETYNASADSVAYEDDAGAEVSDVSYVYFEKRTRGTTTETAATTEADAGETSEADHGETTEDVGDDTDETTASSGDTPGFTPITAVVALIAAALVGLRRN